MRKRILFVINGFGMGNATRCHGLMAFLQENYEIHVMTSDKAYRYFESLRESIVLHRQSDINTDTTFRYGSLGFFMNYIPFFIKRLAHNFRLQRKLVAECEFDTIFFDSDYAFVLHRIFCTHAKLIGVNNSFEVLRFFNQNPKKATFSLMPSLLMEVVDFLAHAVFTHQTLCPAIGFRELNKSKSPTSKFLVCPPLLRRELLEASNTVENSVVIMGSSSNVESDLNKLLPIFENLNCTILVNRFEKRNFDIMRQADFVICNAGQSSLAECFYLGKRSLVVAIPNHAEQFANAAISENFGLINYHGQSPGDILPLLKKTKKPRPFEYQVLADILKEHFKKILT